MARRDWVPVFARINTSAKLAALPNDTYRLFYMMLLPQCDGWGRAPADPGVLDALVWPRFKWAVDVAGDALQALEAVGLVELHQAGDGDPFLQVTGWEEKAGKLYRTRLHRGASEWPSPTANTLLRSRKEQKGARPPLLSSPLAVVSPPVVSAHPASPSATPAAREKKPRKEPTGEHAEAIAHWCAEFQRTRGSAYAFRDKRDGAAVKALLKAADLDTFRRRASALLEHPDPFYSGADLGTLRSAWNKLAAPKAPTPPYARPSEPEPPGPGVPVEKRHAALRAALDVDNGRVP